MRMFCRCRNLESVLKAPCSPGTFILSHLFPCLQHLIIFMAVAVPSTCLLFFPSPDGLDQSVYIAIIFLRSVSLGLTHSSVHQSQSTFSSGIATFHRKVRNNNFLTFPLKYGKLQKKPRAAWWGGQNSPP